MTKPTKYTFETVHKTNRQTAVVTAHTRDNAWELLAQEEGHGNLPRERAIARVQNDWRLIKFEINK